MVCSLTTCGYGPSATAKSNKSQPLYRRGREAKAEKAPVAYCCGFLPLWKDRSGSCRCSRPSSRSRRSSSALRGASSSGSQTAPDTGSDRWTPLRRQRSRGSPVSLSIINSFSLMSSRSVHLQDTCKKEQLIEISLFWDVYDLIGVKLDNTSVSVTLPACWPRNKNIKESCNNYPSSCCLLGDGISQPEARLINLLSRRMSPPSVEEGDIFLSVMRFSLLHVNWDKEQIPKRRQNLVLSRAWLICACKPTEWLSCSCSKRG